MNSDSQKNHQTDLNSLFSIELQRNEDQVPPYDVAISPELVAKLEDCLNQLNLQPVNLQNAAGNEVSLLVSMNVGFL